MKLFPGKLTHLTLAFDGSKVPVRIVFEEMGEPVYQSIYSGDLYDKRGHLLTLNHASNVLLILNQRDAHLGSDWKRIKD